MKYDHMVKANGTYYPAGQEVPENTRTAEDKKPLPFSDNDITFETKPEGKKYTKTEINRMSKAELQDLATQCGIDGAEEMTGSELKENLFDVFGL